MLHLKFLKSTECTTFNFTINSVDNVNANIELNNLKVNIITKINTKFY